MKSIAQTAVAYIRTSSASNCGPDKDSSKRQMGAIRAFAKSRRLKVVKIFNDEAVSGTDLIESRPGFGAMLDYLASNGARTVLCESPDRFARDVLVAELGYRLLLERDIQLIPTSCPEFFADDPNDPSKALIRQIFSAIAAFDRMTTVQRLKKARDRVRAETGRCEGRKPVPPKVVRQAKRLYRKNPKTGSRRTYGAVARELAALGHFGPSGGPYFPTSIKRMVGR